MRTTEEYMLRDREAFASATASAIRTFKDEPRAFRRDREENRVSIAERVILIWSEFERIGKEKTGETINGATNKTEWAKAHKISLRYCEYIIKGKRDRSAEVKKRDAKKANHVVRVEGDLGFLSRIVAAKGKLADIQRQFNAPFAPGESRNLKHLEGQINPTIDSVFQEFLKLTAPDGYEVMKASRGWWVQTKDEESTERPFEKARKKKIAEAQAKTKLTALTAADPKKDLLKRFRAAKKVAKFYVGMMKELEAVTRFAAFEYDKLLELYNPATITDKDYPWTPPSKNYTLPKTEAEFHAEYDAATDRFNDILEEGKTLGVLTDAPREKKEKQTAPNETVTVVVNDGTVGAETYDTKAYAKAKTWGQKVCVIGSPENIEHSKKLEWSREHPAIDPNADDEFAGEGD
jgi:hypothetical protein